MFRARKRSKADLVNVKDRSPERSEDWSRGKKPLLTKDAQMIGHDPKKLSLMWQITWKRFLIMFVILLALVALQIGSGLVFSWQQDQGSAVSSSRTGSHEFGEESGFSEDNSTDWYFQDYKVWVNCPEQSFTKEAKSALRRAKTQACRDEIANVTCLAARNQLFPKRLQNHCQLKIDPRVDGNYLGCFKDSFSARILDGGMSVFKDANGRAKCLKMCSESGYLYAGVQYGSECFCGNDRPRDDLKLPGEDKCNYACLGNPHEKCGGYLAMNVYQTGLIPFKAAPASDEDIEKALTHPARVVYLLTLSGRAVRQVRRLLRRLYHANNYFLIHVDSRQDYMYRELLPLESTYPNIKLVRERMATIWGGSSLLKMLLHCMRVLMTLEWEWDFVLNLSESDYPIKKAEELVHFLSINRGRNFVKSHGRDAPTFIRKQGMDRTFVECDNHMYRIGQRHIPMGIQIDGGSDWICLHRDFVHYLMTGEDETLIGLKRFFNFALLPAEAFFHITLRNSQFCSTVLNNNLHLTNWNRKQGCKCQHKAVVDWCGCSPNDFKPTDWSRIQATAVKPAYFGRKFEAIISQKIQDMVDEWIYDSEYDPQLPGRAFFWLNDYHHEDSSPAPKLEALSLAQALSAQVLDSEPLFKGFHLHKIMEISSVNKDDELVGALVLLEATRSSEVLEIEVLVQPPALQADCPIQVNRTLNFQVGSGFDKKEQIFRNLFQVLGPDSDPNILFRVTPLENVTEEVIFAWFDPFGKLAVTTNRTFNNDTSPIDAFSSGLPKPLVPGMWTVKAFVRGQIESELEFPVFPILPSLVPDVDQWSRLHHGPAVEAVTAATLKLNPQIAALPESAHKFAFSAQDLQSESGVNRFIQQLSQFFYTVKAVCSNSRISHESPSPVPMCHEQSWSSKSPDPKSELSTVNPESGTLF